MFSQNLTLQEENTGKTPHIKMTSQVGFPPFNPLMTASGDNI